jgi:hypothetical protein
MSRALHLVALGLLALAGCTSEGPEDPALATPGAGIPMGAIGAVGVGFDGAATRPDPSIVKGKIKPRGSGKAAPTAPPPSTPDPFAEPPAPEPPTPKGAPRRSPSSSKETTL